MYSVCSRIRSSKGRAAPARMTNPRACGESGGDARDERAAQAVTEHEDVARVDAFRLQQQVHGGRGVVHRLLPDGDVAALRREFVLVDQGPLVVAEHGDALRCQPPGQVPERRDEAAPLIPVIGPRSVHQHHGGEGTLALGHGQGPRQGPLAVPHRHLLFSEAVEVGIVGGSLGCRCPLHLHIPRPR